MGAKTGYFTKDNGLKLPVSDDYLLPFLTPTSPGTNYWDPPPPTNTEALRREDGRVLLQLHQLIDVLKRCDVDLDGKVFCDIGTGNGMIPRLLLQYSELSSAVGVDPYLDGEHLSSWQAHDHGELFAELTDFIDRHCAGVLDFEKYRDLVGFQDCMIYPAPVPYCKTGSKRFRFEQVGAHDLSTLGEKFDIFYAKAIDHIPDWPGIFREIGKSAEEGALIVIKHFSFFSYLGPHRYATTNIPWGHLLLSDDEYRRFAHEFHGEREKDMVDFYFDGLAYPRTTISGMVKIAQENGFSLRVIVNEPMRNVAKVQNLIKDVPDFWKTVYENHPDVSSDEMASGRYHIVFQRI